jgi:hypothetical protein
MTAEMAAARRRMNREHICKWPAMKRMVYLVRCTQSLSLPSLSNCPAPQGIGESLEQQGAGMGPK